MQQTENQRLKILMQQLGIKTQKEFASRLKIQQGSLSDILREKNGLKVSNSIKDKLENLYKVNLNWLETGNGQMFLDTDSKNNVKNDFKLNEPSEEYKVNFIKNAPVPVYDIEFSAGVMTSLIENREDHYPVGHLSIPEVIGCDAIIRAKGDSMADRINDRDWIGIKRLDKNEWFPMGYIYAIETSQAQIIKYIKKGSSPEMLKIVSHNSYYEDDEIPKDLIKELWSVRTVLPFSKIETLI